MGQLNVNEIQQLGIKQGGDVVEVLGVWVGKNQEKCNNLNWEKKISSISTVLSLWKRRYLSLYGRLTVVSSLLMSKLWYTLAVQTIPPKYYLQIKKLCIDFLWDYKSHLVSYETIIAKKSEGGLHFPDIMLKMFSFRLKFLGRLLNPDYTAVWKDICVYFFSKVKNMNLGLEILVCELVPKCVANLPFFCREMLLAWIKIRKFVEFDINEKNIYEMPLFYNPNIKNDGNMLYFKPFVEAGINKLMHLTYEVVPGFLKMDAIYEILSEIESEITYKEVVNNYKKILTSMPYEWINWINENINPPGKSNSLVNENMTSSIDNKQIPIPQDTRTFYNLLLKLVQKSPIAESFWTNIYPDIEFTKCYIYANLHFLPSECKELNFKITHKVLFTKQHLLKCNMSNDDTCPSCKITTESIDHLFNNCPDLSRFHDFLKDLLLNLLRYADNSYVNKLDFKSLILFGFMKKSKGFNFYFANFVLNIARYCIYKRRNFLSMNSAAKLDLIEYFKTILNQKVSYNFYIYIMRKERQLLEKYFISENPILKIVSNKPEILY